MATTPVPPVTDILKLLSGINVSVSFPGEGALIAMLAYATEVRSTMDPALIKRLDAITVQAEEDFYSVIRGVMVEIGVLPK